MKKCSSTVSIHPSTNKSKEDDKFQIKIDSRINLYILQIANDAIQSHIDFSNFDTKDEGYDKNFTLTES